MKAQARSGRGEAMRREVQGIAPMLMKLDCPPPHLDLVTGVGTKTSSLFACILITMKRNGCVELSSSISRMQRPRHCLCDSGVVSASEVTLS